MVFCNGRVVGFPGKGNDNRTGKKKMVGEMGVEPMTIATEHADIDL